MVWLSRSVCPSVWGWNAVDIRDRMPEIHRNSFQTSEVNRESLSDTMSVGWPWCFHTSLANTTARSLAVFLFFIRGTKCAILVNRSTITQGWSHSSDSGSSVMKSIAIDCHGAYGSSRSEGRP